MSEVKCALRFERGGVSMKPARGEAKNWVLGWWNYDVMEVKGRDHGWGTVLWNGGFEWFIAELFNKGESAMEEEEAKEKDTASVMVRTPVRTGNWWHERNVQLIYSSPFATDPGCLVLVGRVGPGSVSGLGHGRLFIRVRLDVGDRRALWGGNLLRPSDLLARRWFPTHHESRRTDLSLVNETSSGSRTKKETRNIPDEIICGIKKRANGTRTEDQITMCKEAIKGELHSHGPRKTRRNGVGAKNSNT
ncbi:hypothetical protein R3P38DRAFT_2784806 [Favolaschia claudopus]|uniref:Uncharacterized protein n=1 Tax=Favolaschia claudopus TaxID=2862362 RepID=A0AAW0AWL9_9AGAR